MQIDNAILTKMLKKVAVLREQLGVMCPGKQGYLLSVMDLHYVVEQVYNLKIEMLDVDFSADYLRGMIERYENNVARVFVRSDLSNPEKRLATVKELCHLALDEEDDWSTAAALTIDGIIADSQGEPPADDAKHLTPLQSEALALTAAYELLYPADYRPNDLAKIDAKETTISKIALEHEIPAFAVQQALRQERWLARLRSGDEATLGIAAE